MKFDATDLALSAAVEAADEKGQVGAFISVDYDDEDRLANYLFEANIPGYNGWRWSVTIAKLDADSPATICDVVAIPGPDALLAPKWIPYADRLLPGDVGVGDIVPSQPDDARLVPGFAALPQDEELDPSQLWELGLGRLRVLSIEVAIKQPIVGTKVTAAQTLRLLSQRRSHAVHVVSSCLLQALCEAHSACAQMQSLPKMRRWYP